jgi:putative transposase
VTHVQRRLKVSERRACKAIGQPRSSQRYESSKADKDRRLRKRLRALSKRYSRYGYRRIYVLLRQEGWRVNLKRVQRLWREEGLRVLRRARKRRRLGSTENGTQRLRAAHPNHVWSYDFVMDQTEDGRRLKMLPVVDEYTREAHAILVKRSITAEDVVDLLAYLFSVHGEPVFIRSDNGPEFIAHAVQSWLERSGVRTLYIKPGSPWENAYSESFNSRFRDEVLNPELFTSLTEAQILVEQYRVEYNHVRPHSSLGYVAPAVFAARQSNEASGTVASAPDGATAFDHPTGVGTDRNITQLVGLS